MTLSQKLYCKAIGAKITVASKMKSFFETEDGDTNFISIALIAAIVVGVAIVFRVLAKDTMDAIVLKIKEFFNSDSSKTQGSNPTVNWNTNNTIG